MVRIPATQREPVRIPLSPRGGLVHFSNASSPYVVGPGVVAPATAFHFPEPWGQYEGGVLLAPGSYRVCSKKTGGDDCRMLNVAGGEDLLLDFGERSR